MARRLRLNYAGAWYHVTSRGNERKAIYRDDVDRMHFVDLFSAWRERFRVRLRAYVLMENHYHLLLGDPRAQQGDAEAQQQKGCDLEPRLVKSLAKLVSRAKRELQNAGFYV